MGFASALLRVFSVQEPWTWINDLGYLPIGDGCPLLGTSLQEEQGTAIRDDLEWLSPLWNFLPCTSYTQSPVLCVLKSTRMRLEVPDELRLRDGGLVGVAGLRGSRLVLKISLVGSWCLLAVPHSL